MEYCTVRTGEDVDWVVSRVLRGDRVTVHVGGIRLPRHHGLGARDALCSLGHRLTEAGAVVYTGCGDRSISQTVRGRNALVVPAGGEGGHAAGVREPRSAPPAAPLADIRLRVPL